MILRFLYLLHDGNSEKRVLPGWCGSLIILSVFLRKYDYKVPSMMGMSLQVIVWAMSTIFCSLLYSSMLTFPNQTMMNVFSTVHLQKFDRTFSAESPQTSDEIDICFLCDSINVLDPGHPIAKCSGFQPRRLTSGVVGTRVGT